MECICKKLSVDDWRIIKLRSRPSQVAEGCIDWIGDIGPVPYPRIRTASGKIVSVTQAVLERAQGPAPTGKSFALHSCDRPCCVNAKHLRWGNHLENMQDKRSRNIAETKRLRSMAKQRVHADLEQKRILHMTADELLLEFGDMR